MINAFSKRDFPSLVLVATYRVRHSLLTRENLSSLTDKVREAIDMKALSPMIVDSLPSPIFGVDSWSVNQPLMTSIMSMDSWPEIKVAQVTGGFVILVHSCQKYRWQDVHRAVKEMFPEADLLRKSFKDCTCRGIFYALTRGKLWFLDWYRGRLRRPSDIVSVEPNAEIA
jgi:hypothetical protein